MEPVLTELAVLWKETVINMSPANVKQYCDVCWEEEFPGASKINTRGMPEKSGKQMPMVNTMRFTRK